MNAISPGVIDTPMNTEDTHDVFGGMHPLGRMGKIADIVQGMLYLENAPFVTGEFCTLKADRARGINTGAIRFS